MPDAFAELDLSPDTLVPGVAGFGDAGNAGDPPVGTAVADAGDTPPADGSQAT
jgi:hypothetical protein